MPAMPASIARAPSAPRSPIPASSFAAGARGAVGRPSFLLLPAMLAMLGCLAEPAAAPPPNDLARPAQGDGCCRAQPGPTLVRAQPATGSTAGGLAVRLFGSGFLADSAVSFGEGRASISLTAPGELMADLPPRPAGCARVDIALANADGQRARLPLGFSYRCAQLGFLPRTRYVIGGGPRAVALADLDQDRRPDLLVADPGGQRLLWLRGEASGAFAAPKVVLNGISVVALTVADFNQDGLPDLALLQAGENGIRILLGRGDGSFRAAPSVLFPAASAPSWLITADLNSDGAPDLALTAAASNEVAVLLGLGNGSFGASTSYLVGRSPLFVAAADVDGNGALDLLTVNVGSNDGSVLLGKGDGQLRALGTFAAGRTPYALALADLDADGKLDLAIASPGSNSVLLAFGGGDGTFKHGAPLALAAPPYAVAIADLDGDDQPDLVVTTAGQAQVYRSLGGGGFATPQAQPVSEDTPALLIADVDGDTLPDLVLPGGNAGDISVLRNSSR